MNVGEWVYKRAVTDPDDPFLKEAEQTDREFTNHRFNLRVNRTAHALSSLGVTKGDRISLVMLNSSEFLEIFFACAKIGAIMAPVNFRLAVPELLYIMGDSRPKVLVYSSDFSDKIAEIKGRAAVPHCFRLGEGGEDKDDSFADLVSDRPAGEPVPASDVGQDDPLVIMYTSGTTGDPKGAVISHQNITFHAIHNLLGYGVNRSFRSLVTAPLFHIGALSAAANPVIYAGGSLVLKRFFNASEIIKLIVTEKINYMFAVPVMYQMMAEAAEWDAADFSHVRYFITGGAPIPVPLIQKYQREKGISFAQGLGLTETGRLASLPIADSIRKAGSVGKEEFHVILRIVDEAGNDVAPGEVGEIIVRGPNVFTGYWNKPAQTGKAFAGGWFHTGDMGRRDEEGFLYLAGRKAELIISSGENIYPAEIEKAVQSIPEVKEAAAVAMPDQRRGEVVAAFVSLRVPGTLTEDELIERLSGKIAPFKIPRKIFFVDEFPRSVAGKILKKELKKRVSD
jgi:fatty-acyl-CoA synthase